ncbi:DUF4189 domain-containing protein [uncultured Neisseria sp.]|uniref:DUF4189 domain-containing protein n=1 Tax=uncultured Neisseria sp. TaxID=237778 RepID=UPI00261712ED|nr:DUF4189 domain-containing protein [uncultured Neisseria sp.]
MKKLFLLLLCTGINVYAYDVTQGALQNDPALCSYGYNSNCPSGNTGSAPPSKKIIYHDVVIPPKFGALAYSQKAGHIAGSLNHNSLAEAQREAVKRCQQGSRNTPCKPTKWIRNGCLAVAQGKIKNKFVLAEAGGTQGTVEQLALQNCKARGATECKILMSEGCSLP